MSEVFRTDNDKIIRREDGREDEFFTEEEYEQTGYNDAPESKAVLQDKKAMQEKGAKVNRIVAEKKIEESEEKKWYQKGQYE